MKTLCGFGFHDEWIWLSLREYPVTKMKAKQIYDI